MSVLEMVTKCKACKREIPEGTIYFMHPTIGIVCEYCPEFEDGPIKTVQFHPEERISKLEDFIRKVDKRVGLKAYGIDIKEVLSES